MTASTTNNDQFAGEILTLDRRRKDRRADKVATVDAEAGSKTRRKKQRRRHIDPTTCERDYNDQEIEFMRAMDDYKQSSGRMFPTCSEVLEVVRSLGYVKLDDEQIAQLGLDTDIDEDAADAADVEMDELGESDDLA
ncbi:hypothetical protein [Crateriforma conspicua]|uniref:Uncharacterized protein n=1 Tax=Crateriforma conspicua TaxID=2527996 RepID=A0A5C6FR20_9PLAN|nr:hypothetical protein [Crateriforma conspicua]TWU65612.1 hypothetical protein V7x_11600 [Crateriforma conspicua]